MPNVSIDLINIIDEGIIETIITIHIKKLEGAVTMLYDLDRSILVVAITVTLTRLARI